MVPNTLYGLTFLGSLLIALSWLLEYLVTICREDRGAEGVDIVPWMRTDTWVSNVLPVRCGDVERLIFIQLRSSAESRPLRLESLRVCRH